MPFKSIALCVILNQTLLFHIVATLNSLPYITVSFQIFPAFSSSEEEKLNCFQLRFSVFAINVFSQRAFICGFNEIAHHRWKTANPDVKKQQIRTRHSEEGRPVVGDTEQNPRRLIFGLTHQAQDHFLNSTRAFQNYCIFNRN